jgi:hypothetical protein
MMTMRRLPRWAANAIMTANGLVGARSRPLDCRPTTPQPTVDLGTGVPDETRRLAVHRQVIDASAYRYGSYNITFDTDGRTDAPCPRN